MHEAALTFDEQDVVMLILQNQFFGRAAHEIGDNAVNRQTIAFDHDARLSGGGLRAR